MADAFQQLLEEFGLSDCMSSPTDEPTQTTCVATQAAKECTVFLDVLENGSEVNLVQSSDEPEPHCPTSNPGEPKQALCELAQTPDVEVQAESSTVEDGENVDDLGELDASTVMAVALEAQNCCELAGRFRLSL